MESIKTELLELLRRNDLLRAALMVGKVQDPNFCPEKYVDKVLELSSRVWNRSMRSKKDPILRAQSINYVLFQSFGLQGKKEGKKQVIDDPKRYCLHEVLDRKVGCPLSLALLYALVAEQVGLSIEIVALPSYYFLKVQDIATEFYIDPYEEGRFLTPEEYQKKFRSALQRGRILSTNLYEKVSGYQMVARLLQQLKHIYILKGSALEALRTVELLTGMFPQSPELTRDRGILYCEMEYFSKAMDDLRFYLKQRPNADDVGEIKKLTSMLKGYREVVN